MAYDVFPDAPLPKQPRPYIWLERLLLLAFAFCLVIGLLALAIWWTLRTPQQPSLAGDPLPNVRSELVLPQLALRQLAGDSADGLAGQAIQAGQAETARSLLTYDTQLTPIARAGRLAQLGRLYQEADEPIAAAQTYRLLTPIAVLDLSIAPLERAQLLVQSAKGLLAAGQLSGALDAAEQAQQIAIQTPELLPAQRSQIFSDLKTLATAIKDPAFAAKINDLARNPFLSPMGVLIPHRLSTFAPQLAYDEQLQAVIAARRQAAALLADRIALTNGADIDPERQALAQALLVEDGQRAQLYQQARSGEISLSEQTALLEDRLDWLVIKLRIANLGFGISLLPEWEQQVGALLAELGAAYNDYAAALDAHAAALPTPADQALQRVENQMWLAQQVERGLYTSIGMSDLSERLRIVQDDVARQIGALALPVAYQPEATPPGFRIQPQP